MACPSINHNNFAQSTSFSQKLLHRTSEERVQITAITGSLTWQCPEVEAKVQVNGLMRSMTEFVCRGSTSTIICVRSGVVVKHPLEVWEGSAAYSRLTKNFANNFFVERKVLDALGLHPRIVNYQGWQDEPENLSGLLLAKASHGNLQQYLEGNYDDIPLSSISYIHHHGVIHSDLRPDNFLVHETIPMSLDLWLCDFGGSFCKSLDVDGKQLPDPGFFDPNTEWVPAKSVDIFSVGSVLYSIITGHWPHREAGPFKSAEDSRYYDEQVEELFRNRDYPVVNGLFGGNIILGCWTGKFASANDVLHAWDQEIRSMNDDTF